MNYTDMIFIFINYYFLSVYTLCVILFFMFLIYFFSIYNYILFKSTFKIFLIYTIQLIVTYIVFMKPYGFVVIFIIAIIKLLLFKNFIDSYMLDLQRFYKR